MSRRFALVAALAAALLLPGTASAVTATVVVTDNMFTSGTRNPVIFLGGTVAWQRMSSASVHSHTTTADQPTLVPWDMPIPAYPTATAGVEFDRAGGFAYHCSIHNGMRGTVMVQMSADDSTPQINQTITITFALAAAPSGFSEQIQKRKAGGTWRNYSAANTATTVSWKPTKAKSFEFRARLVNGGVMSNWSPTLSLTVTP